MDRISGFGTHVNLTASITFPVGLNFQEFSDDTDAIDIPSIPIADVAMGLNGDLITWAKATPIKITISVIPNSEADINLGILLEANRVGFGKLGAEDVITLTAVYTSGKSEVFTTGVILEGTPANSVASAGRIKTKTYMFAFENRILSQ